jgi:hypothetical protein
MGDDACIRSKLAVDLAGSALIPVTIGSYKACSTTIHYQEDHRIRWFLFTFDGRI